MKSSVACLLNGQRLGDPHCVGREIDMYIFIHFVFAVALVFSVAPSSRVGTQPAVTAGEPYDGRECCTVCLVQSNPYLCYYSNPVQTSQIIYIYILSPTIWMDTPER